VSASLSTLRTCTLLFVAGLGISIAVAGPVVENPRAARSVHLHFLAPKGDVFYNEVTVEQTTDGSYFMACGWDTGYFGMQQLGSPTNKVVIFSVWDPTRGDDANGVPLEQRVEVLYTSEGSQIKRFGGEGTGGQCKWPYLWATNETCRFAVVAKVEGEKTSYAGWFFDGHAQAWRHLVTFRTRTGGRPLSGYYSFIEDFRRDGQSVNEVRRARFGNGWVRDMDRKWISLRHAQFTASNATWESKDNINAGLEAGEFYLVTGGDSVQTLKLGAAIDLASEPAATPPMLPVEMVR
jgi:hypothetical protein